MPRLPSLMLLAALAACGPTKDPGDTADLTQPLTTGVDGETGEPGEPTTTAPTGEATTNADATGDPTGDPTTDPTGDEGSQVPPRGAAAVEAWLAEGHYKGWACEPAVHGPLPISPHGMNRICSNDALSGHPPDGGEYPVGSAGVKELYDEAGAEIVGYAVYLHVAAGTTGDTWYWYERVPLDSPAPHDGDGVVADGLGSNGPAQTICVGCHQATGIDADHPGHDYVYTQVQ